MKRIFTFILIPVFTLLSLQSCDEGDSKIKQYFAKFTVNGSGSHVHNVTALQNIITNVERHDLRDSDLISVAFSFFFTYSNPERDSINHALYFILSFEIPGNEFDLVSGKYVFKQPENLINYLPDGNLFESADFSFYTYYHEDVMTFCTSLPDPAFSNNFQFTRTKVFPDENNDHLLEIEGSFAIRYKPSCQQNDIELNKGIFIARVIIEEN